MLGDQQAAIYQRGEHRYLVVSKQEGRLAIIDTNGLRISVYQYTETDLNLYGEPLWILCDLIN